ncbi:hypothetical protein E2C01_019132 [Portunus trituberculatus]|uniref:Uncharacterized protein n=1 Tax=Portunus trituberculatus TaxID=210409 RepID=A0A5B7DXF7_PORTR|nr:hypothetical protein [Portunus trituberculatus]
MFSHFQTRPAAGEQDAAGPALPTTPAVACGTTTTTATTKSGAEVPCPPDSRRPLALTHLAASPAARWS